MSISNHYLSKASQVANALKQEFPQGQSLPAERRLAEHYQVSRKTIRKALLELRASGTVTKGRNGRRVGKKVAAKKISQSHRVALLMAEPLENLRPYTALWVYRLGEKLSRSGLQLDIHHGHRFFGRSATRSRESLVQEASAACWVLAGSNQALQDWFQQAGIPAVIAGSPHEGITIPGIDIDHRAMCRHAVTALHRQGHQRAALFLGDRGPRGDRESEEGFREGATACGMARPLVFRVKPDPTHVVKAVDRALAASPQVTGMVLASPFSCLTVMTHLANIRRQVPRDVSLISCHEEPYLPHLRPVPTHYTCPPAKYAAALHRIIRQVVQGAASHSLSIVPEYVPGASLARPRQ